LLFLLADVAVVMVFPDQILSPLAYLDYRSCLDVDLGKSDVDVSAMMEEPRSRISRGPREQLLVYGTLATADGPVAITLKESQGKWMVVSTACHGME
jgi:hypothetical protein